MKKGLSLTFGILLVAASGGLSYANVYSLLPGSVTERNMHIDDEYDRYKKRGDDYFTQGDYQRAKGQYSNCLLVPGFEQDNYAKQRIAICEKVIVLQKNALELLNTGKSNQAMDVYLQILTINAGDPITRNLIVDYWSGEGNKLYEDKNYLEAKSRYQEALKYSDKNDKKAFLLLQVKNCDQFIALQNQPSTVSEPLSQSVAQPPKTVVTQTAPTNPLIQQPRRIVLKTAVGVVAVGSALYAYRLYADHKSNINALNKLALTVDTDKDNQITNPTDYDRWQQAYNRASASRSKQGLFYALSGTAVLTGLLEGYLLVHKPKLTNVVSFTPSFTGVGLAFHYKF